MKIKNYELIHLKFKILFLLIAKIKLNKSTPEIIMVDMTKIFRTGEDIKQFYKFDK